MADTIELIQPILGMEPYVLLVAKVDDDNELSFSIKAGGGITTPEDVRVALILVLSGMAPLTAEELAELSSQDDQGDARPAEG